MGQDSLTDAAVAEGLRRRDHASLEAIINRYSREIFYLIRLFLGSVGTTQDVEECVSDLFVSVWQDYEAFDASRGSFRTWLSMRAKYLALDRRRQLLRKHTATVTVSALEAELEPNDRPGDSISRLDRQRLQDSWTEDSLESLIERREQHELLRDALIKLPDLDRQLVYMRYFKLVSTDEMAAQTGLSKHAIDTRIWRARKQLKEALRVAARG